MVKRGLKTEYRKRIKGGKALFLLPTPMPVILSPNQGHDFVLAVLEETWREPLGAIGPESLQREGFTSFPEFRRYWVLQREFGKRRFISEDMAVVYRIRICRTDEEVTDAARVLLARLYGPFVPDICAEFGIEPEEGDAEADC